MKLSLISIEKLGYVQLAVEGDITSDDFLEAQGKNPFEPVLGAAWASQRVVLNMEKTNFVDSSAIGWLIDSQRAFHAAAGKLVLHSAPPRVQDLFDLLKMRAVVNLQDDEKSAQQLVTAAVEVK